MQKFTGFSVICFVLALGFTAIGITETVCLLVYGAGPLMAISVDSMDRAGHSVQLGKTFGYFLTALVFFLAFVSLRIGRMDLEPRNKADPGS